MAAAESDLTVPLSDESLVERVIAGDEEGDFYIDTLNGDVYAVVSSAWVFQLNITGPDGDEGETATASTTSAITIISGVVLADSTTGNMTLTLPPASGSEDRTLNIKKTVQMNRVTVEGDSASETIDGDLTFILRMQYSNLTIWSDGSVWWIL